MNERVVTTNVKGVLERAEIKKKKIIPMLMFSRHGNCDCSFVTKTFPLGLIKYFLSYLLNFLEVFSQAFMAFTQNSDPQSECN